MSKQTPLQRLVDGKGVLNPNVSISGDAANGIAPDFQRAGFIKPD